MRIELKGSVQFLAVNNSDRYNSASLYLHFLSNYFNQMGREGESLSIKQGSDHLGRVQKKKLVEFYTKNDLLAMKQILYDMGPLTLVTCFVFFS